MINNTAEVLFRVTELLTLRANIEKHIPQDIILKIINGTQVYTAIIVWIDAVQNVFVTWKDKPEWFLKREKRSKSFEQKSLRHQKVKICSLPQYQIESVVDPGA